jgi:hypothetical protein
MSFNLKAFSLAAGSFLSSTDSEKKAKLQLMQDVVRKTTRVAPPAPPGRAALPLDTNSTELLYYARQLIASMSDHAGQMQETAYALSNDSVEREAGLSSDNLARILHAACDACSGERYRDSGLQLLGKMEKAFREDPKICLEFYVTADGSTTTFDVCLERIETTASPQVLEQLVSIMVAVESHCGLGVANLSAIISRLTSSSPSAQHASWPRYSTCVLRGLCQMASRSRQHIIQIHQGGATAPKMVTHEHDSTHMFSFDGLSSGLYLCGNSQWPFEKGYAFETWVWRTCTGHASHLMSMCSDEEQSGAGGEHACVHVIIELEGDVTLHTTHGNSKSRASTTLAVPVGRWSHIVISHLKVNTLLRRSEADVWVDGKCQSVSVNYPSERGNVRVYAGCRGFKAAHVSNTSANGSLSVRPYCGLMRAVRIFRHALNADDVAALLQTRKDHQHHENKTNINDHARDDVWMCVHPGGLLNSARPYGGDPDGDRTHDTAPELAHVPALLGGLCVGGLPCAVDSLEALGHVDAIMTMLMAVVARDTDPQLYERLDDAQEGEIEDGVPVAAGALIATEVIQLLAEVLRTSHHVQMEILNRQGAAFQRVVACITYAMFHMRSDMLTTQVLAAVLSVWDALYAVENSSSSSSSSSSTSIKQIGTKQHPPHHHLDSTLHGIPPLSSLRGEPVAFWALTSNVWAGRGGEVHSLMIKELYNMLIRDPQLLQSTCGLHGMLHILQSMLRCEGTPPARIAPLRGAIHGSCDVSGLRQLREFRGKYMTDGQLKSLRRTVVNMCTMMLTAEGHPNKVGFFYCFAFCLWTGTSAWCYNYM